MKFAIYHREREYAREMGDPKLREIEAASKEDAERLTAHLGMTGTIAVPLPHPTAPDVPSRKPISAFLGQVICGDCIEVMRSMPSESIDLVVTDPPYLVNYQPRDGRRCMNDDNADWVKPAFREIYRVLKPDRICATFYGWPWIDRFMAAWKECGFRPVSHLTWVKQHSSRVGYTAGQHEVGYLLAKGRPSRPLRPLSDVLPWEYTGNTFHPNQKPVVGIQPLIEAYSEPGQIILDPFAGSGSTGRAALASRRHFILVEKEAQHCRAARARLGNSAPSEETAGSYSPQETTPKDPQTLAPPEFGGSHASL